MATPRSYVSTWQPPPKLSLSEWADLHFRLSAESAAEPGRWRTLPYQRGVMDAITDPAVMRVSWIKSARVGATKLMDAAIAYHMHYDPCSIMVVQPTVEDAEGYSKEEIAPMIRDVPVLVGLVKESTKISESTILHKTFRGGLLSMVGANSGRGFRRVSRRLVLLDEVDGYPLSAGAEGDPVKLAEKRSEYFWNRKIVAASTPLVAGTSRIEELFESGDRRRFYVPCPQCGHMDVLRFRKRRGDDPDGGHRMRWPDGQPEDACFECGSGNGCVIEERHKRAMIEAGEWRAEGEFAGHASFHIWAAYSLSPNATWGQIASEFIDAKSSPEKLRTFVNTVLGETWQERGEAPDHERLYQRREPYKIGTVPDPAIVVLTCGVDVQKDRFVYEVVGWARNRESWSIDYGELLGDTALDSTWNMLDELLARTFPSADGAEHAISMMAIDSGAFTQPVYDWARRHPISRVIAIKGDDGPRPIVGAASPVEINFRGKRIQRGYRVFPVGVDTIKGELYGWLRMPRGEGDHPAGWCHFPEHDPEYFKQLTAEHLVTVVNRKTNRSARHWHVLPNRENHALDCRVYARAAAAVLGIDRLAPAPRPAPAPPAADGPATTPSKQPDPQPSSEPERPRSSFWKKSRGPGPSRPGGWLGRRR